MLFDNLADSLIMYDFPGGNIDLILRSWTRIADSVMIYNVSVPTKESITIMDLVFWLPFAFDSVGEYLSFSKQIHFYN